MTIPALPVRWLYRLASTHAFTERGLYLMDALGSLAPGVGVDLSIYPLGEFERRSQVPGTLLYRARQEGRVLHDSLH